MYPDYLPAVQAIACHAVKDKRTDARLKAWLEAIALQSESPRWREWAEGQVTRVNAQ